MKKTTLGLYALSGLLITSVSWSDPKAVADCGPSEATGAALGICTQTITQTYTVTQTKTVTQTQTGTYTNGQIYTYVGSDSKTHTVTHTNTGTYTGTRTGR